MLSRVSQPTQSAFHIALASLGSMTAAERQVLAAACTAYDADTSSLPALIGSHAGVTYYADGSISLDEFESYFASQPPQATPILHNFFFTDTDAVAAAAGIDLPQEALDNIAYNRSVGGTPTFNGEAYSAATNGKQFNPKSVKALPYAVALRNKVSDAPSILQAWQAQSFVPTEASQTFAFVAQS